MRHKQGSTAVLFIYFDFFQKTLAICKTILYNRFINKNIRSLNENLRRKNYGKSRETIKTRS